MSIDEAAILACWTVLLLAFVAVGPHLPWPRRLGRPEAKPLLLDPMDDLDGPMGGLVIDLEPA